MSRGSPWGLNRCGLLPSKPCCSALPSLVLYTRHFGEVYAATNVKNGSKVVVKIMKEERNNILAKEIKMLQVRHFFFVLFWFFGVHRFFMPRG